MTGKQNAPLNAYLSRLSETARRSFRGPLTYMSLPFEVVDWKSFDFIGVDHYRDAQNKATYGPAISRYRALASPSSWASWAAAPSVAPTCSGATAS